MSITFGADKVKVSGPNSDDGYTVTLYTGEYMQQEMAKLLLIPTKTNLKITVEVEE